MSKPAASALFSYLLAALLLAFILVPFSWAAEKYIGTIRSPDGGTFSNYTCLSDGGSSLSWSVPAQSKLSVQCGSPVYFALKGGAAQHVCAVTLIDGGTEYVGDGGNLVTATDGILIPADALFQTSTDQFSSVPITASILPYPTVADAGCKVWTRTGNE